MLKAVARNIVFPFVTAARLERILSFFSRHKNLIIMYHGVVRKQNLGLSVNHLSLQDFEQQILYFRRNFDIVPVQEMFSRKQSGIRSKRKTIAITFDDGYENNYVNAFPVLRKFNIPATIFVVAGAVRDPDYTLWYDKIDLLKSSIDYKQIPTMKISLPADKMEIWKRIRDISALKNFMKTLNTREKEQVLSMLFPTGKGNQFESTDVEYRRMLGASQMKEMVASGYIEIGSHSMSHPNLDKLNEANLTFELSESKKELEQAIGSTVQSIAFPDGAYNDLVKNEARKAGYQNLLAVDFRQSSDLSQKDILPRFCISNTTTNESNYIMLNLAFDKLGF